MPAPTDNCSPPSRLLVGTKYRTYKRATDKLAGWLAVTAKRLGGKVDSTLPKLKDQQPGTCGLRIAQFSILTDLIVEATPKVEVPLEIVDLAQTAFQFRQERADLLAGTDLESDKKHRYVITVIEEVFQKLKAHLETAKPPLKPKADAKRKDGSDLVPSYQVLDIDPLESCSSGGEDGDIDDAAIASKTSKNKNKKKMLKQKRKTKQQAEQAKGVYLAEEDEDPYFVLMCLLSDLKSMREYIKEIWQEYRDGKLDLVTVSLTTNATFDVIRTYEDDFPAISSLLSDYTKVMEMVLSRSIDEPEDSIKFLLNPSRKWQHFDVGEITEVGEMLSKIPEVVHLTMANAFYFLNGPIHNVIHRPGDDRIWISPRFDPFGRYQPEQDHNELSPAQQLLEDIQVLTQFGQSIMTSLRFGEYRVLNMDHFTMQWDIGVVGMSITLAQVFGTQMFLDIHHVMREDAGRAFQDVNEAAKDIVHSIEAFVQTPLFRFPDDNSAISKYFERTHRHIQVAYSVCKAIPIHYEAWKQGKAVDSIKKFGISEKELANPTTPPLIALNPLLCGIVLFQLKYLVRNSGSNLALFWDSIQVAGQIYYSCQMHRGFWEKADKNGITPFRTDLRLEWQASLVWPDMDSLIEMMGVATFFNGAVPTSIAEIVKQVTVTSFEDFQRDFSFTDIDGSKFNARTHQLFSTKYGRLQLEKICDDDNKGFEVDWTLEKLQDLLEFELKERAKSEEAKRSSIKIKKGKGWKKRGGYGVAAVHQAQLREKDGNISQVNILRVLKETLQSESRALNFDNLSFHATCLNLLRSVHLLTSAIIEATGRKTSIHMGAINDPRSLKVWALSLQRIINDRRYVGDPVNSTSQAHIIMDTAVKQFLESSRCGDRELKKIDSIRGIISR